MIEEFNNGEKMSLLIETKRLLIKIPILDDLDNWNSLHSDPEVMRFMGGSKTRTTVQEWLESDILHYKKHGFCMGSVFDKNNKKFMGRAGLVYLDHDDTQPDIEIGYVLHKEQWNKGYGLELVLALIGWGFSQLNVNRLVAVTRPENKRSQKILEKANMQYKKQIQFHDEDFLFYHIHKVE
ncbi:MULTISPECIES: GNAT family N-acetyltransferase [Legionella]|uniref:GNAT family acetyltransferase n=1 Tax=Legionella drozanskii LLAP-1 TaxID=1212489 RepID=A0A0W0SLJ0_9GAMM|nr:MULTISPECIES: GNAT family N-acetyltransferase [Legionella]KTC84239.1 GNAT family acetyltransferase [Legionella drozanskii LLAP-1]